MDRKKDASVVIFSTDAVFSRMLILELSAIGIVAMRSEKPFPTDRSTVRDTVCIADTDTVSVGIIHSPDVEFGFGTEPISSAKHYFQRPFRMDGFLATVAGLSERCGYDKADDCDRTRPSQAVKQKEPAAVGLTFDNKKSSFRYNGEELSFTETEQALLTALYKRRGSPVSREELLSEVWGRQDGNNGASTNLTDVYIRYLREKLDDRFGVRIIYSVRGIGYKLI